MDDFDRYLQDLATSVGSWLQDPGPEGDVAVSTRIRVARNVMDFPFGSRLEGVEAMMAELEEKVEAGTAQAGAESAVELTEIVR